MGAHASPVAESLTAEIELLNHLSDQHSVVRNWSCGAVSVPVWRYGEYHRGLRPSDKWEQLELHCTKDLGHESSIHTDGAHCWARHTFTEAEVAEYRPRDRRMCMCGTRWADCKTAQAIARYDREVAGLEGFSLHSSPRKNESTQEEQQ